MPKHDALLTSVKAVQNWVEDIRAADHTRVEPGSLATSSAWALSDGRIRHASARYFSLVGLEWMDDGVLQRQPFIEQREIGTLGFIARPRGGSLDLLVHAKAEPGNVGIVQLAPTCQATASNRDRVHGGGLPPFSSYFDNIEGDILSDTLQSEHGSRFLGKRNRNIFVVDDVDADGPLHRWIPLELFKTLLGIDFLVNTDARSVLCCTNWRVLSARGHGDRSDFGSALRASVEREPRPEIFQEALARLDRLKQAAPTVERRPIENLSGWTFNANDAVTMTNDRLTLRHIRVHCATRETHEWDQPILHTLEEQIVELLCRSRDGVLEFAFRPQWEPGLVSGAELGPTFFRRPAEPITQGIIRARVRQSDEGGRFYRTTTDYRIVEITQTADEDQFLWVRLSEVQAAMPAGIFNNEARSALSVILAHL
ncbi:NDP-hexose 2,3-dehydratase family protein [soil metagenome]